MSAIKLPWTFYSPLQIHARDANIHLSTLNYFFETRYMRVLYVDVCAVVSH